MFWSRWLYVIPKFIESGGFTMNEQDIFISGRRDKNDKHT